MDLQLAPPGTNHTAIICYVLLANNVNIVFGLLFAAYLLKANEEKHIPTWIKSRMIIYEAKILPETDGNWDKHYKKKDYNAKLFKKYEQILRWIHTTLQTVVILGVQGLFI